MRENEREWKRLAEHDRNRERMRENEREWQKIKENERMTADGDEKWDNGQFNLDKLWDPPPSLHIWDTCDAGTRAPGREGTVSGPRRHFPRSQSRHRRDWLSWETPSQISAVCWHPQQTTDSSAGPWAQTGNLNRPLIVLTSSSWINIVDLVKLPKHQPRPAQSNKTPGAVLWLPAQSYANTQFNGVILWRMGWEEFALENWLY